MKRTIRRLTALLLICLSLFTAACASAKGSLSYVPVTLTVEKNKVTVEGIFRNTFDYDVSNFTDFELVLYEGRSELMSAEFGTMHFTVEAHNIYRCTLVVTGRHDLPLGEYDCNACDISADFSCTYRY